MKSSQFQKRDFPWEPWRGFKALETSGNEREQKLSASRWRLRAVPKTHPRFHENHAQNQTNIRQTEKNQQAWRRQVRWSYLRRATAPCSPTSELRQTCWRWRSAWTRRQDKTRQTSPQFCRPEIHKHVLRCLLGNFTGTDHKHGRQSSCFIHLYEFVKNLLYK